MENKKNSSFKMLNNIASTFNFSRRLSIVAVAGSLVFAVIVTLLCLNRIREERQKIYVLDHGRSLILALQQDLSANRPVEAVDHVRMFHEYFFTLMPDNAAIQSNISRAINLADKSAYNYYVDLAESGFYRRIIGNNIMQNIIIDSIVGDYNHYPYRMVTFATQDIIRESVVIHRSLITTCLLVDAVRSENNPHGFLIKDFYIKENKTLKEEKR